MTRVTQIKNEAQLVRKVHAGVESLARRPGALPAEGFAIYQIEVYEPDKVVGVQDEVFEWEIPEDLDGSQLVKVDAYLTEPSSSGTVQVMLSKEDPPGSMGDDILSTKINLDVGEYNMKDAATQPVINPGGVSQFDWGDHIRIDIDNAGSGAKGLGLILYFLPAESAEIIITGAKGDAGGVTTWGGTWEGATTYVTSTAVNVGGTSYVSITNVPAGIEPGVTPGWEDYWMVLSAAQKLSAIEMIIDGQDYVIDIGRKPAVRIPYSCDLLEVTLLAEQTGSILLDLWRTTYDDYETVSAADSIVSTSPPELASEIKSVDTILSGWTTALDEDDIIVPYVETGVVAIKRLTICLKLQKT